jgi:hypothetical protein
MKVVRLIKMCLNETCSEVRIGKKSVSSTSYSEWSETRTCFITSAFQLCFRIWHQEGPRKSGRAEKNGAHQFLVHDNDVNILGENTSIVKKNTSYVTG